MNLLIEDVLLYPLIIFSDIVEEVVKGTGDGKIRDNFLVKYKTGREKNFVSSGTILNCSFKTYGGSENNNNELYTILDTAIIETWYNPILTSDCRIKVMQTNKEYEILGEIENINMRNQFVKFKVRAVLGGA